MGAEVRYAEIRWWARTLRLFTADIIADSMLVDHAVGERAIKALLYHGIVRGTDDYLHSSNGAGPQEIYEYIPLPPGPREHFTYPPEWHPAAGICGRESFATGRPVAGTSSAGTRDVIRRRGSITGAGRRKKTQGPSKPKGPKQRSDFEGP